MAFTNNPRKNSEGYSDPTVFEAFRNIDIEGRIVLVDKKSGRIWR